MRHHPRFSPDDEERKEEEDIPRNPFAHLFRKYYRPPGESPSEEPRPPRPPYIPFDPTTKRPPPRTRLPSLLPPPFSRPIPPKTDDTTTTTTTSTSRPPLPPLPTPLRRPGPSLGQSNPRVPEVNIQASYDISSNRGNFFFAISGDDADPRIVVKKGRGELAWSSRSLGSVVVRGDRLQVVRGAASICCRAGGNCARKSDNSCDCGRLTVGTCDVDQAKVSAEYLAMAERFALRHSASPFFLDKTGGEFLRLVSSPIKVGREGEGELLLGERDKEGGGEVTSVYRRD